MNPLRGDRYACSLCGKSYTRKFDLKRHKSLAHREEEEQEGPEESSDEDSDDHRERQWRDESEGEEEGDNTPSSESNELEDNDVYRGWYEEAVRANHQAINQKYRKYLQDEQRDDDGAREKAYAKTLWAIKRDFFDNVETYLIQNVHLRDDDVFQEIVGDIDEKMEGGMDLIKAVKRVLPKYKHQFASLFEYDPESIPEDEEDSSDMEDTSSSQMGGHFL